MKKCLFLCTGNYYRSRFAEEVFNHYAPGQGLDWSATSRALVPDLSLLDNEGFMSPFALAGLRRRGIPPRGADRMPCAVREDDLAQAGRIVAVCEREHRPMVASHHPAWVSEVEFWSVEDLAYTTPGVALDALEADVRQLIARLAAGIPTASSRP